ncbi:TlyA family RNA methyltransferase [Thermohalobacter berrensis]|uniref:Hemolysin n=1 Tax=Thermohalobacter berrensis TaxID=99594 RepID=A0A419TAT5_9FIRM|nr:TlyA family RNA methyltransferase [Thermohalobacter berrensis]RKD34562.1 hemolysin [Thermohalobacter berrensis]
MKKERIDVLLVKKGFAESREKAKKIVMAGLVFIDQDRIDKPGTKVTVESNITVKGNPIPYVSRGGLKLEKALNSFEISVKDKIALDIGASTGGFTDCMLKNGAKKVYAIDVGYGQLAWKLREDNRVIPMERTNVRYVKKDDIGELADFATIDVSFISLKLVLPVVKDLLKENGQIVALIKPQFEAGREKVGKKGVVRDKNVHKEVIHDIFEFCKANDLIFNNLTYSPIKGAEGNIEYLAHIINGKSLNIMAESLIDTVVDSSHKNL